MTNEEAEAEMKQLSLSFAKALLDKIDPLTSAQRLLVVAYAFDCLMQSASEAFLVAAQKGCADAALNTLTLSMSAALDSENAKQ